MRVYIKENYGVGWYITDIEECDIHGNYLHKDGVFRRLTCNPQTKEYTGYFTSEEDAQTAAKLFGHTFEDEPFDPNDEGWPEDFLNG